MCRKSVSTRAAELSGSAEGHKDPSTDRHIIILQSIDCVCCMMIAHCCMTLKARQSLWFFLGISSTMTLHFCVLLLSTFWAVSTLNLSSPSWVVIIQACTSETAWLAHNTDLRWKAHKIHHTDWPVMEQAWENATGPAEAFCTPAGKYWKSAKPRQNGKTNEQHCIRGTTWASNISKLEVHQGRYNSMKQSTWPKYRKCPHL